MNNKILIAGHLAKKTYYQPYLDAVASAGGEPVLDWPGPEIRRDGAAMRAFMAGFRGVVLPGGIDIDPGIYGEVRRDEVQETDAELDAGHLAVARFLLGVGMPGLGICRGLQILAVAAGGRLFQDLHSQYSSPLGFALPFTHKPPRPDEYIFHDVSLRAGSRLARICGAVAFKVNSRHHQAVRAETEGESIGSFSVAARAPDGVIEALESPSPPFLLAVQWHPEDLVNEYEHSRRLFRAFIDACGESRR
ncbi:MAG: gamma-glutamyl-gamma-aminobutyrate hydrolase family protein [Candidatus Aminicenantales bacterium]